MKYNHDDKTYEVENSLTKSAKVKVLKTLICLERRVHWTWRQSCITYMPVADAQVTGDKRPQSLNKPFWSLFYPMPLPMPKGVPSDCPRPLSTSFGLTESDFFEGSPGVSSPLEAFALRFGLSMRRMNIPTTRRTRRSRTFLLTDFR